MIGKNGNTGADGNPGKDGVGIKKTLIEYAKNTSGTVKPTTGWSTTIPSTVPGDFLWTRTTWTYTDSTSEQGYTVGKIGNTGATGPQGPKGDKGDTGEADYTEFRTEYESEINQLSDEITLRVKSSDYIETVDKLDGTITSVEELSSQTTELVQTSDGFEQRFTKVESNIDDNQKGINEIKAVVSTGIDEYGNPIS